MSKVDIINVHGAKTKEVSLPAAVFGSPVNEHLLYEAVKGYRANQRRGTVSTKVRGEVSGSTRKPWRQKGTGRARVGSIRSPLWRKGGTVFGPRPRSYYAALPQGLRTNALKSALSLKSRENHLLVLEALSLAQPKTKEARTLLAGLKLRSVLIVDSPAGRSLYLAARNIPKVKVVDQAQLTVYDVLNHEWLVLTEPALNSLVARLQS